MSVVELLQKEGSYAKVCAPMVRYSKLNFRQLVRNHGVDLCFTPMIIADSFIKSAKARNNEFSTCEEDTPLVVQFASSNHQDFLRATEYVVPYSSGVDLNCGCPQRWAIKEGYGCALLSNPQVIFDCVRELRNIVPSEFSISAKVRLLSSVEKTVAMCEQLEKCGVSFLTIHARTADQKYEPIHAEALKVLKENLHIPIIANGDIFSISDADNLFEYTRCNGIMSARGLLRNPALFAGSSRTPVSCIENWISMKHYNFMTFLHHLLFMCDKILSSEEKEQLNSFVSGIEIVEFLEAKFNIQSSCKSQFIKLIKGRKYENENNGKFFEEEMLTVKKKIAENSSDFLDNMNGCFNLYG